MINATKVFIYTIIIILVICALAKMILDMPLIDNDKSVNVLLVYLIVVSLVTITGVGLSYNIQPTTKNILPPMGDKGRKGNRGNQGKAKKCGIKCSDNAGYLKIMHHISNVYNLWLKANRRPLLGEGKLINNEYIKSKVNEMSTSNELGRMLQLHGAHKLHRNDNPMRNNICDIKTDCGAYDYVFQMWHEWILIILKYEKGQMFLDSENMNDEDFNNMMTDSDIISNDFTKDWIFNPGEPIDKLLDPNFGESDEERLAIKNTFFKSDFVKFYTAPGVPDAHNYSGSTITLIDRAKAKLKIKSPFEEIQEYDAWYWGANPLSVPQFINKCEYNIVNTEFNGKIKVKLSNDYIEMWDSSEARQSSGRYNMYSETYKPYQQLGSAPVKIFRAKDFYDNNEKNLDFRSYKPVGDVIVTTEEAEAGKSMPHEHFPRFLKKSYNSLPNQNDNSGPRRLTILVSGDTKHPTGFDMIYTRKRVAGFQAHNLSFSVWRPIPPRGYVSLGDVVSNDPEGKPPDTSVVVCVPENSVLNFGRGQIENTYKTRAPSNSGGNISGFTETDYDTDNIITPTGLTSLYFKTMIQRNDEPLRIKGVLNENSSDDPYRKNRIVNPFIKKFNTFRCTNSIHDRNVDFHRINISRLYDDSKEEESGKSNKIYREKAGRKYSILKLYE